MVTCLAFNYFPQPSALENNESAHDIFLILVQKLLNRCRQDVVSTEICFANQKRFLVGYVMAKSMKRLLWDIMGRGFLLANSKDSNNT